MAKIQLEFNKEFSMQLVFFSFFYMVFKDLNNETIYLQFSDSVVKFIQEISVPSYFFQNREISGLMETG